LALPKSKRPRTHHVGRPYAGFGARSASSTGARRPGRRDLPFGWNHRARNRLFEDVLARLGGEYREGLPLRLPQRLRHALDRNPITPAFLDARRPKSILAQRFADGNGFSIVVLVDLRQRPEPHAATLQHSFGLTRCEARLASSLASGLRLRDIAQRYGVEVGTIRAQLKSVFLKTGTQRQSELVSLLARLPLFL
jgi:DNA-binding CsgD family transcriptional regulator